MNACTYRSVLLKNSPSFLFFSRNYYQWSSKPYSFQFYMSKRKNLNCLIVVIKRLLKNMSVFRKTKKEKSVWKKLCKANNDSVSSEKTKQQRFVVTRSSRFRSGEQTKFFSKRCRQIGQKLRFKGLPKAVEVEKSEKFKVRKKGCRGPVNYSVFFCLYLNWEENTSRSWDLNYYYYYYNYYF